MMRALLWGLALLQLYHGFRFLNRVRLTFRGKRIDGEHHTGSTACTTVIVPVLNEEHRLRPCLSSLIGQGDVVGEILLVDGGSTDRTHEVVCTFAQQDSRVRLVDASPVPSGWNGKAWGLQTGLQECAESSRWVVTTDADVRVGPDGVRTVVGFAEHNEIPFLSVACLQRVATPGLSLVHPSLLSTLVYRFGVPGQIARSLDEVQSNGQFAVYERTSLLAAGGFEIARDSICEDVTLARHLFLSGYNVGFYEGEGVAETEMHADGFECLRNWPRSLSLRDRFRPSAGREGLISLVLLQVIPLLVAIWAPAPVRSHAGFRTVNRLLLGARIGVLVGTRRAYSNPYWTYWLSPLFDPLTALVYSAALMRRSHSWRGRSLIIGNE